MSISMFIQGASESIYPFPKPFERPSDRPAPLFSVVVVHYQGVNSHETFLRGIRSLQAQTFRDFEILCYHDGPLLDSSVEFPLPITCTPWRYNDWGHSLRDRGIREARGQYIIHFNADNILYPNALEEIANEIRRPSRLMDESHHPLDTNDIIIFPVRMVGMAKCHERTVRFKGAPFYMILTGVPPVMQNIDCMQLVMKRKLWLDEGGWSDKSKQSDGTLYERFTQKYGYRIVGPVVGDHY